MSSRGRRPWPPARGRAWACCAAALLLSPAARADGPTIVAEPPPPVAAPASVSPPPPPQAAPPVAAATASAPEPEPMPPSLERPRFSLALGMGVSFDDSGIVTQRTAHIPSFFGMGGFGDGFVGIDLGVFSNNASGRFRAPDVPVDRLAAEVMVVIRPACHSIGPDAAVWPLRLLRTIAFEAGVGYERDGRGAAADHRSGPRIGGRIELPLSPARDPSELRLRIGVRRLFAGTKTSGAADMPLKDSTMELYGALAIVF